MCFEKPKLTGSLSSILPENMLALFTKLCDSYKPLILGVGKTRDGQTSVTVKIGKTRDDYVLLKIRDGFTDNP